MVEKKRLTVDDRILIEVDEKGEEKFDGGTHWNGLIYAWKMADLKANYQLSTAINQEWIKSDKYKQICDERQKVF
jgi:hypothetical protein